MIYDVKTKNKSFIEMYGILKAKGIKNNKFHLMLYDKKLQGVDPYSKNLTLDQKIRIRIECQLNPWYYLREVVRIPESGGVTGYQLHLGNLSQAFCMINNINVIQMLPRQHGKTIGAVCIYVWIYHFTTKNTNMIFGNKQLPDAKENLKRFKDITNLLPDYLLLHTNEKADTDNLEYIRTEENNNTIKVISAPNDEIAADKAGRGLTTPIIWMDEFSFLKHNDIVFASAAPAQSRAAESALKNGTPYGKLLTTTPSNLDDPSGLYTYDMIDKAIRFDEGWFDLPIEEVKEIITTVSKNDFVYIEYSYKQLGRDEAWFNKQCKDLNHDLFKIKREILLQWMLASNDSPFSEEQLVTLEQCVKEPISNIIIKNRYRFDILEPLYNAFNKSWIVSIDIATGLSQDSSAITVIDPLTQKPIIVFRNNTISIPDLVDLVEEFVTTYIPNAVIVPERNSVGIPFINLLLKSKVSKNVYYEIRTKKAEKTVDDPKKRGGKITKEVRVYGVNTNKESRGVMTDEILNDIINNRPECIIAKGIFEEIKTLRRNNKGKIEHRDGCHDDLLFAYLIGLYAYLYGENINRFVKVTTSKFQADVEQSQALAQKFDRMTKPTNTFGLAQKIIETYGHLEGSMDDNHNNIDNIDDATTNRFGNKRTLSSSTLNFLKNMNKK